MRDAAVLPETVIYDVDLTLTLPVALAATSGINAIAHAVEALYARDTNPDDLADGGGRHPRAGTRPCPRSRNQATTARPAPRRSMAPGSAASA